jgi:hypothetical protein
VKYLTEDEVAGESPDVNVKNDLELGCGLHFPASTAHKIDAVTTTANNFEDIILHIFAKESVPLLSLWGHQVPF